MAASDAVCVELEFEGMLNLSLREGADTFGGGHFLMRSNSEEGKIGSGIERRNDLRSEAARNGASGYEARSTA